MFIVYSIKNIVPVSILLDCFANIINDDSRIINLEEHLFSAVSRKWCVVERNGGRFVVCQFCFVQNILYLMDHVDVGMPPRPIGLYV